jgi:hypothetical protein
MPYGRAMALLSRARAGAFTSLSARRKRLLLNRFVRLLREAGVSGADANRLQGAFDEALRTPRHARAQPTFLAGGPRLPGQTLSGTARPDYTRTVRLPGGRLARAHVNLKSDRIDLLGPADAAARARRHVEQAIRNAVALPAHEPIVIRYAHTPAPDVRMIMLRQLFRPGSPVYAVHFGTIASRNPVAVL